MATKNILALNIGSSQLTLAEYAITKPAGLELLNFSMKPIGLEPGADTDPSVYIVSTIRDIMRENDMKPGKVLLSVSGKDVFPRYVKLPPVTSDKVDQIVFYEAQQNVPFPIDEVVWDYQLFENEEGGHSVMLVAIKTDIVKRITDSVEAAGLEPDVVDVAPLTLYNLVRFNYGESDSCALVMDMGARSTNLVFIEQHRAFSRSIPVAGHTITQELMKEFEVGFKEAEELKIAHAFVAFSGAVEGADSQIVNRVSKTVRSVMTRLHAEVSRSINFYRSQQSGAKPSLVLLAGGTSIIPETDTFLREKLGIPVEYLNPFQNVAVSNTISAERASANMHILGEVTGLALRRVFTCPMEINLMPPDLVARKTLRSRIPFFAAAAIAVLLAVTCWTGFFWRKRVVAERNLRNIQAEVESLNAIQAQIDGLKEQETAVDRDVGRLLELIGLKTRWIELLGDIRSCLLDGMWITAIEPEIDAKTRSISRIQVTGMGFVDKVKDAKTAGQFGNALKAKGHFADFNVEKVSRPAEWGLQFMITLTLAEPVHF